MQSHLLSLQIGQGLLGRGLRTRLLTNGLQVGTHSANAKVPACGTAVCTAVARQDLIFT